MVTKYISININNTNTSSEHLWNSYHIPAYTMEFISIIVLILTIILCGDNSIIPIYRQRNQRAESFRHLLTVM